MVNNSLEHTYYSIAFSFCLHLITVFNCNSQSLNWAVKLNSSQQTQKIHASDDNNIYLVQRDFSWPYDRLGICIVQNNGSDIVRFSTRDFNRSDDNTEINHPIIRTDNNRDLLLTGFFCGNVGFDPEDSLNIHSSQINSLFLTKYNSEGKYQWSRVFHSVSSDPSIDLITDMSHYYLSAGSKTLKLDHDGDTVWSNPHSGLLFLNKTHLYVLSGINPTNSYEVSTSYDTLKLSKIDTSGHTLWSRNLICGTDHANYPYIPRITAEIFLSDTKIYIHGKYWKSFDFNPSQNESYILSNNDMGFANHSPHPIFANFIAVYDTSGNFQSVKERLDGEHFFFKTLDEKIHILGISPGTAILYDDDLKAIGSQSLGQQPSPWWYYFVDFNQSLFISDLFRDEVEFILLDQSYIVSANYEDTYVTNYSIDFKKMEVNDDEIVDNLKISPNPVRDILSISQIGKYTILLFDLSGKLLLQKTIRDEGVLDCTNLNSGIYILRVLNNSSQHSYKVIKL